MAELLMKLNGEKEIKKKKRVQVGESGNNVSEEKVRNSVCVCE